ncbi:YraN family protein [Leucobacter sp. cx-42]|uniref:YraN family protein n=1 Tax=unclassified Leucobacter TaxID=2621730 RepID=UPI00165E1927|nr:MULTISPECIES: YraN family protein [unclassified Leucobacter]MBC9955193.1 YraN family protein [Leucobacter sp. cx-42]
MNEENSRRNSQALGARGEALAARFLVAKGYTVLARNWRTQHGELDLIVSKAGTVVAVEVKTRRGHNHGHPLEAITARKCARLKRLLLEWVQKQRMPYPHLRIDAIGITLRDEETPRIDHLRGIQ